jgi:rod shape-determining protein MreC
VWVFTRPSEQTQAIQHTIGSWFAPFTKAGAQVQDAAVGATEEAKPAKQLQLENEQLQIEVDQLRIKADGFGQIAKDNADLRAALGFREQYDWDLIAAEIVNRKQSAWYREAVIDKGTNQGIIDQMPVLAAVQVNDGGAPRFEGALVGKVGRSEKDMATIVFLTDENCRVAATVKGLSNVRGILMGSRSSTRSSPQLRLRFLKSEPVLEPGRQVYCDGSGKVFPFGVLLGEVSDFHSSEGSTEAEVRPAVDFDVLRHVFVFQLKKAKADAVKPSTAAVK